MKPSIILHTVNNKRCCAAGAILLMVLAVAGLFVGKYPLSMQQLLAGDAMQWRVFLTLRCSRTLVGVIGGFALGVSGFVYQTVFGNPLASPDIIGVSSGASAGASGKSSTIVLAGIAVHSLAQTVLMCLKLTADPERELASIEYWMMGSLNGVSVHSIGGNLILCVLCMGVLFLLHRQIILLSAEEGEARMLGVRVAQLRLLVLMVATLSVSSVVSLTGLISFVGLLAPHGARMLTGQNRMGTMLLGGLLGGILLCGADILARSVASTELPVSIFTSVLGAPFLIFLIVQGRQRE